MIDDLPMKSLHFEDGKLEVEFEPDHDVVLAMAHAFNKLLDDTPAVNYLEMIVQSTQPDGPPPVIVTIIRQNGKRPHELKVEAERERDAALARVAELEDVLNELLEWADNWLPDEAKSQGAREVCKAAKKALEEP